VQRPAHTAGTSIERFSQGTRLIPKRFEPLLFALLMSMFMSFFMSFVITFINLGFIESFVAQWLGAFWKAFMVAFPTILLVVPSVRKLVGVLVKP
jgi:hypothetical protein